jgi:allantoicase
MIKKNILNFLNVKKNKIIEGCHSWETEWPEVFNKTHLTKQQHHIFVLTKK